ncbi:MAG TPA: hypothetical protein VF784_11680 [Anaerolineales bacterium]
MRRDWLVKLYPSAWRERYGDEFEMLLAECLRSPLDVVDLLLGALDAHLEFPYGMNWRTLNMLNKLRTSILLVFAGYIGFVLGGMSLYGLADDSPMASLMKSGSHLPLSAAWFAVELGSAVSLLAVVVGGAPLAFTLIRRALSSSHKNLGALLVPVLAFLALVLYAAFAALIAFDRIQIRGVLPVVSPDNFPVGNRLLISGFMFVLVLGAIASTAAVWHAASNADDEAVMLRLPGSVASIHPYRFALIPAMIAALGMLWMLLATIAWGWLSYAALPDVFSENWGLLLSNTVLSFAITLAIMICSTVVAFFGVARGFSSRKLA